MGEILTFALENYKIISYMFRRKIALILSRIGLLRDSDSAHSPHPPQHIHTYWGCKLKLHKMLLSL